ncbi:MAG: hypothetical protein RSD83_18465, partial [Hafnia sp.]|uniref:hypothetical protein n=1 Tax=Hafnia sp. TaxID=1873498 RepID=UPI002FCA1A4C
VRPRPTAIFPDGGSIMHSIQHEKDTAVLFYLCLFNCLSLGRESRRYRDVSAEFGAPWMGDTKPERRWHLG